MKKYMQKMSKILEKVEKIPELICEVCEKEILNQLTNVIARKEAYGITKCPNCWNTHKFNQAMENYC